MNYILEYLKAIEDGEILHLREYIKSIKSLQMILKIPTANIFSMRKKLLDRLSL